MLLHRLSCLALTAACTTALYFRSSLPGVASSNSTVSAVMGTFSLILAAGLVYRRYRQVCTVSSLIPHAPLVRQLNIMAIISANAVFLGFLLFATLFLFKVTICSTVGDFFVYGFGTLYICIQCILTYHLASLHISKNLTLLRLGLATLSFLVLMIMVTSEIVGRIINKDDSLVLDTFCHHLLLLLFCIFLMSFDRDYQYLNVMLQNDLMLDDQISTCSTHLSDSTSAVGPQQIFSYTSSVIKCGLKLLPAS